MLKSILCIDYGGKTLKLVELRQNRQEWQLANWAIIELLAETPEELGRQIAAAVREKNILARDAVIAVSQTGLVYQLIDLPPMPAAEIQGALQFKLEPFLSFPVSEAVFDYSEASGLGTADKHLYLVAALQKNVVDLLRAAAKKAGLRLTAIIPAACCLKDPPDRQLPGMSASVFAGREAAIVSMLKNDRLVFAREIISDSKQALASEISRTFEYYRDISGDQETPSRVVFSGESSLISGFVEHFQTALGLTVELYQSRLAAELKEAPLLAAALGARDPAPDCLDLTREPEAGSLAKMLAPYKFYLLFGAAFVLLLALAQIWLAAQKNILAGELARLNGDLKQRQAQIGAGSEADKSLKKIISEIGIDVLPGQTDQFVRVMRLLDEITPDDIYFEQVAYARGGKTLELKGIVLKHQSNKMVTEFVERLKISPLVETVALKYLVESKRFTTPTFEFEISCVLGGR